MEGRDTMTTRWPYFINGKPAQVGDWWHVHEMASAELRPAGNMGQACPYCEEGHEPTKTAICEEASEECVRFRVYYGRPESGLAAFIPASSAPL